MHVTHLLPDNSKGNLISTFLQTIHLEFSPDLADLVTARLHGLLLTLELGQGHLELLEVGVAVLDRSLAAHEVLHCLLEDFL